MFRSININSLLMAAGIIILASCQKTEKAFYPDGKQKFIYKMNNKGKIHGEATWWYPNGNVQLQAEYIDGVVHGKMTRYYENGQIQSEYHYEQGKLNGVSREMNIYGKLLVEKTFRNDTLHGISRQYDENGQVVAEGNYEDGRFEGKWLYRSRLGDLTGVGEFEKGTGHVKSWDANGKLARLANYVDNVQHGFEFWYDSKSRVIRKRTYDFGDLVSDSTFSY